MTFVIPHSSATEASRRPEKAPKQPKIAPCWLQTKPEQQKKTQGGSRKSPKAQPGPKRGSKTAPESQDDVQDVPKSVKDGSRSLSNRAKRVQAGIQDPQDASKCAPGGKKRRKNYDFSMTSVIPQSCVMEAPREPEKAPKRPKIAP